MQVVTVPVDASLAEDNELYYDPFWLAIVKESQRFLSSSGNRVILPAKLDVPEETIESVKSMIEREGGSVERVNNGWELSNRGFGHKEELHPNCARLLRK